MIHKIQSLKVIIVLVILISAPGTLLAYGGPGLGLTAIGIVLSLIAAIFLAIVGFIWYPFKRLLKKIKDNDVTTEDDSE